MTTAIILMVLYAVIALLCLRLATKVVVGFVFSELMSLALGMGLVLLYADAGHGPSTFQTIFIVLFGMAVTLVVYGLNFLRVRWLQEKVIQK